MGPLSERFRVVAPDLRGYGDSDKPPSVRDYVPSKLIADVPALIRALGYEKAVVIGHDWGGFVAWGTALLAPECIERLVVLNCPHPALFLRAIRSHPRQMLRSWYMGFFQLPFLPELLLGAGGAAGLGSLLKLSSAKGAFSKEDLDAYRSAWLRPGAATAALNYYRAVWREPALRRRLEVETPKISTPTLLIWGDHDSALGVELTEGMEPLFSGPFSIKRIAGASHWVQEERPGEVNDALLRFLA